MLPYKSTLFLATQHIKFTTHYFDFESKNCARAGVDQTTSQRKTENLLKMEAKYKAKPI